MPNHPTGFEIAASQWTMSSQKFFFFFNPIVGLPAFCPVVYTSEENLIQG